MTEYPFSPREFLKQRRPERFSDSAILKASSLDRSLLEYHLDVLTSKKQETAFEHFARAVAQREICPNLLPQTGPTGGGDSKVDSETYPVADALSMGWFVGIGREAASERWAFAFSAKKEWRSKLRSDIAKLTATERKYTTAYFITNQYVRDKDRASLQDTLSRDHGLDVWVATAEYWTYGDITNAQLACYENLRWLELELGRLPQLLCWHQLTSTCHSALALRGESVADMDDRDVQFDATLGILFLKLDLWSLSRLERLPDTLYSLGLMNAAAALQWLLGPEHLPEDFLATLDQGETPSSYFALWLGQPAAHDVPNKVELGAARKVRLESWVLGCNVVVESEASSPCLELSESFLAALESLLATAPLHGAVSREPRLTVSVRQSEFADRPFSFQASEELGRPHFVIATTPFDPAHQATELQHEIKGRLFELLVAVMQRIVAVVDLEDWLNDIFDGEGAISRAVDFTGSMVTLSNVLGDEPRNDIGGWVESSGNTYRLTRDEPWNVALGEKPEERAPLRPAQDSPPDGFFDPARLSHRGMRTFSLIREQLWDKAEWSGTMFEWGLNDSQPPVLAPVFKSPREGAEIFLGWQHDLGSDDPNSQLRICIIRGIDCTEPCAYRVSIGSDLFSKMADVNSDAIAVGLFRLNTMHPSDSSNLDRFLKRYAAAGRYLLAPAAVIDDSAAPVVAYQLGILKENLVVRQAWEIGLNDPDSAAIHADEDPILPEDGREAPVAALLEAKRAKPSGPPGE